MIWNDIKIGSKIAVGFGLVLLFLLVVVLLSYIGVGSIVQNAEKSINGNKLHTVIVEKEVDHLNWANKVNSLLTDENLTELDVETDHHKCGFGKWLYGEGREGAEQLVPELVPLLNAIEEPHEKLHESAREIGKVVQR